MVMAIHSVLTLLLVMLGNLPTSGTGQRVTVATTTAIGATAIIVWAGFYRDSPSRSLFMSRRSVVLSVAACLGSLVILREFDGYLGLLRNAPVSPAGVGTLTGGFWKADADRVVQAIEGWTANGRGSVSCLRGWSGAAGR